MEQELPFREGQIWRPVSPSQIRLDQNPPAVVGLAPMQSGVSVTDRDQRVPGKAGRRPTIRATTKVTFMVDDALVASLNAEHERRLAELPEGVDISLSHTIRALLREALDTRAQPQLPLKEASTKKR